MAAPDVADRAQRALLGTLAGTCRFCRDAQDVRQLGACADPRD
jgi:hypothetical protein